MRPLGVTVGRLRRRESRLARELADVLHYFLPESDRKAADSRARAADAPTGTIQPIAVPVGERDAVRVAFVWQLALEIARAGRAVRLVVPDHPALEPLRECLPTPAGVEPGLGPEFAFSGASDLGALARDARELEGGALALTLVPTRWLRPDPDGRWLLAHPLVFATPDATDLRAAQGLLERLFEAAPDARPGVTLHGVGSLAEAERAFDRLALRCENGLGRPLLSYGVLVDDLQVYRAVVDRRPVAANHPHSVAARALADVARLLVADHPLTEGRTAALQ